MKSEGTYDIIAKKRTVYIGKKNQKNQIEAIVEKRRKTSLLIYGVDNPSKSSDIKAKISKSNASEDVIKSMSRRASHISV